ncbi:MAG: PD-(D/E)XK nuclease family protein, partial [Clostridia bacterium]|nr:PD-(D/E)XK nuclease family protein [Clostridia bacterium]
KSFLSEKDWTMNPDGYTNDFKEWGTTVLADANRVKSVMREPLSKLSSLFSGKYAAAKDICAALYEILISFDVHTSLSNEASCLEAEGRREDADTVAQSFGVIVDALNTIIDTVPEERVLPGAFSGLLASVASTFDIGTIPSGVDMVTLGSAVGVRCGEIRRVILAGCVDGEFPATPKERGLFNDTDKEALEGAGIIISDKLADENGKELFRFWRCLTMPSDGATLTYPAVAEDAPHTPSVGARQVMRLLNEAPRDFSDDPADAVWSRLGARDEAMRSSDGNIRRAIENIDEDHTILDGVQNLSGKLSAEGDTISKECAAKAAKSGLSLTQGRTDSFSECPFSYYMKYVVKPGEQVTSSVDAADVGTLIHHILEVFLKETADRVYPLPDDETEEIVGRITKDYIEKILNGASATSRQNHLFFRLKRSACTIIKALMKEFSETKFRPFGYEIPLGVDEESPRPLEFRSSNGTKITIYGTIDRVDTYVEDGKTYVRVVDYKTGSKSFRMSDVGKGVQLQLLLYLFTIWKGEMCSFRQRLAPSGET